MSGHLSAASQNILDIRALHADGWTNLGMRNGHQHWSKGTDTMLTTPQALAKLAPKVMRATA